MKKIIATVPGRIKCGIAFDNNPSKVYFSGQVICGNVHLCLSEPKNVRSAFVKFIGKAYVYWTEGYGDSQTALTNKENFFDERIYPASERNGTFQYLPGSHKFSFEFTLPLNLPTSLEAKYGWIRYKACFVLDIPLWPDDEFEESFTVIKVSNLNPYLREPVLSSNHKTFNTFCLLPCATSDPLETVAQISAGGYIPRETIDLHLNVNNRSNQPVLEITVQLIQEIKYCTSTRNKTDKVVLKQEYTRGCEPNREENIIVNILVPTVPPSQNRICKIIEVQYYIRIMMSVSCCHSDPELILPIKIGSNPIEDRPALPPWINSLYLIDSIESRENRRRNNAKNPFLM